MSKKIAFGCDHRGFLVKTEIFEWLAAHDYEVIDCGTFSEESCDYPDFVVPAAKKISEGECELAIGVCHTGIGTSIIANKVPGVRASLCHTTEAAELTRAHNNSNMLVLGSGFLTLEEILSIIEKWVNTPFDGGRHERRVNKITECEREYNR